MPDLFFLLVFFIFGAALGSFANVLIVRMPEDESIIPRSRCRSCKKQIPWFSNFPLFSWLILRGKCRMCGAKIPFRYFLVELLMATFFALTFYVFGLSWYSFEVLIFVFGAITASFIDIDHMILPDEFTLGGTALALIGAALNPERSFWDACLGAFVGGGLLFAVGYIYWLIRKREGMGGGDIKLLAWIGALMGVTSIPFVLMVACVLGTVHSLYSIFVQKKDAEEGFPFGPAIVAAAFIYLFVGPHTMVQLIFPSLGQ